MLRPSRSLNARRLLFQVAFHLHKSLIIDAPSCAESVTESRITRWLSQAPAGVFNAYALTAAFVTYFSMYAFRKPFSAAKFEGLQIAGTEIELKTAFVISQIIGYALSKFAGIKFCTEASRRARPWLLVGLVGAAEAALVLFAVVPGKWKLAAIFLNGLPLGMVWGLVVRYLEGRRTSDILLSGLACSFIVSSGVVKDVGRALLTGGSIPIYSLALPNPFPPLSDFWMPAAAGLLFAPLFLLAVWLLDKLPEPTLDDTAARSPRAPMDSAERRSFFRTYLPGIVALVAAYVFLTAFRDFRDNYMVELLEQLGYDYEANRSIMSQMELGVAVVVMFVTAMLFWIKDNRHGFRAVLAAMGCGVVLIGIATLALEQGWISGFWWMALIGLGSYLAYVPYNTVLFDRMMASTRFVGTAVFGMYLADSAGYTGSVVVQLGKDVLAGESSRLDFMCRFARFVSLFGVALIVAAAMFLARRMESRVAKNAVEPTLDASISPTVEPQAPT